MKRYSGNNGQSLGNDLTQRFLIDIAEEPQAPKQRRPKRHKREQPPATERDVNHKVVDLSAVPESVHEELMRLSARADVLEVLVSELREKLVTPNATKEYYTTQEIAVLLGKRPYTVREWCRLGRVNAEKTDSGRGLDAEWRISQTELTRIQNEGLLRREKPADVRPDRHLRT